MKTKFLSLIMLLTLGAMGTMKAQSSCDPITVTATRPYIEHFSTDDWPHANTTNNYDLFSDYPENCWQAPYTIEAADGTSSPRLWYNGEGNPRHISLKEGSSTTQDQYVLFPAFSNPIKDLTIEFKANINMSDHRSLYIGYYNTETQDAPFAYYANGEIIITGIADTCDVSLQVIDVMGRVVRAVGLSQCGSRTTTTGMASGLYVLRLINGNDVKTQKVVIQ